MVTDPLMQTRSTQECINFGGLSFHRSHNGRVMQHNDSLLRAQLSHSAFEFQRFINRSAHESFDLGLTKRCKYAASKATNKTLGPREAHPIALVGAAVEHLDSL